MRSDLLQLGTAPDGTAQVPADPQRAGWFSHSARPGDEGPAVILGHIDSKTGPAVFYRLRELVAGATVIVDTASGRRVAFTVNRVEQVAKDAFPTNEVYGPAFGRQLRLITCGGTFDRSKGHYRDNVIAFLTAKKRPGQP
ncbi:MAG: sortase [Actinomycetota bacterium]|nr:sortase [Actinomycetota bacterium]